MTTMIPKSPFHAGELEAQTRAGVGDIASWAGGFIRDYLPDQHRAFHTAQPFLIVSGSDQEDRIWVTLVEGEEGFIKSPDPRSLTLDTAFDATDPLVSAFEAGTSIGVLGIEPATRRRNRFSGDLSRSGDGFRIDIRQTFGNCPQYIHERAWTRVAKTGPAQADRSDGLSVDQINRIRAADTVFIGSGHENIAGQPSSGYDASHRGGGPGFVRVLDQTHLQIPDYAGNNFFNTIGNLVSNSQVGLLFIDFETGGLLHISGRATIDWEPDEAADQGALRFINVTIEAIVDRPAAVGLRWQLQAHLVRRLKLVQREMEAGNIASFTFEAFDGQPLASFVAGQHLPIKVQIPGQKGMSRRTYSLSGSPLNTGVYRLSIKREERGLVSRFFHDTLRVGGLIDAHAPSGTFVIPCDDCPLVLVSAGVGLTPMISMLHANATQKNRPVWFVHGARHGRDHAFREETERLVAGKPHLRQMIFYSQPDDDDVKGRDYDVEGRISADHLLGLKAGADARYMLCGPAAFLAHLRDGLEAAGVPAGQIHFEAFGLSG